MCCALAINQAADNNGPVGTHCRDVPHLFHSLLVMGSMNSSGSSLLEGSSGLSPSMAARHSTAQHSTPHVRKTVYKGDAAQPISPTPSRVRLLDVTAELSLPDWAIRERMWAVCARRTMQHIAVSDCCSWLRHVFCGWRQVRMTAMKKSNPKVRYVPLRLPPNLRKSSMGTTMVVCTVGRTALLMVISVMVVSVVLGRKNTHGMSGQVCEKGGDRTGREGAGSRQGKA